MDKKKGLSLFGRAMLIYAGAFLALSLAVWIFLWLYIGAYEVAGSKGCMRDYVASLQEGQIPQACEVQLQKLDFTIKSEEESRAFLQEKLQGAGFMRVPGESSEGKEAYSLICDREEIARIQVEDTGKSRFGFAVWQVTEENYDLEPLSQQVSYSLPEGYRVTVGSGEAKPGPEKAEFESLKHLYERFEGMPYLAQYSSGLYLGEAEVKIYNEQGALCDPEQLSEAFFLSNLSGEAKTEVEDFGRDFIQRYVDYGAINGGNFYYNFARLKHVMDPYGELYARVNSGWGGIFYTNTKYCEILSMEVNFSTQLQEDLYLVDLSYRTETQGLAEPVESDNNARVVVIRDEYGALLATAMFNY